MKKWKEMLLLIAFSLSMSLNVFAWDIPKDITFIGLEKIAQDVKKTVFSIQLKDNEDNFTSVGTGFLIKHDKLVLGITCKHIVKHFVDTKKNMFVALNTSNGLQRFSVKMIKIDPTSDIAILIFNKDNNQIVKLTNLVLASQYLDDNHEFNEGRAVLIPGYPLGIGAKHDENNPVVRFGIVAQRTENDTFLVDGVSNHGNSGSPVFDMKESKFIGMITSYENDYINLFDSNGNLVSKLPYNSGLSTAVTSKSINKTIDSLF